MTTSSVDEKRFRRRLTLAVLIPLAGMTLLAGILLWQVNHLLSLTQWVDHSDRVIAAAYRTEKLLVDAETGLRGYVLTADESFLEPYRQGLPRAASSLDGLARLVADNPPQVGRVERVRELHVEWQGFASEVLTAAGAGGDLLPVIRSGRGKRRMDAIRAELSAFVQTEEGLRDVRARAAQRGVSLTGWTVGGLVAMLGGLLAFFTRRQLVIVSDSYRHVLGGLKRQAEALRWSEERFRSVVEHSSDAVALVDASGKVVYVSPAVTHILGYTPEEFTGRGVAALAHPGEFEALRASAGELVGQPDPVVRAECRALHKDGSWRLLEVVGNNLLDEAGVGAVVINFRDVTARREAEEALRQTEERLRQSQKLESVGRLAGGIAHDFNNLLTVITGYSDLLLARPKLEAPVRSRVMRIKEAADRASALTRQLLAFSRKQMLQPVVLDLTQTVSRMHSLLGRLIGEDVSLLTVLDPDLKKVKADPGQIEQVIMNLAVNARDAMPGGGKLTIETKNVYLDEAYARRHVSVTPGSYVMLAVSDTGVGMDAETQSHIFEPFFTTKEPGKGTGLGLAMVYGIVKQSGGNIWLYSEPGHGTTFKIYLPVAEEEAEAAAEHGVGAERVGGTETILVVEDEEAVRLLLLDVLGAEGYAVLAAADGHEALDICGRHGGTIDLLLTDVVMPGMSGRQLAERLAGKCRDMKVLYMSGYTDNAIVHHGVLDPDVSFLQKPFTPDAVLCKVREVLDAGG